MVGTRSNSPVAPLIAPLPVSAVCSLSDFRLARSLSLSVGAWLPSAAPDSARALDWAAADFCLANSVGGGGQAMGSASPPAGWQHRGEGVAALHLCATFPRAREGGASASGFDPAAPARSYGDCSARADRNRWLRVGCGVCALWHFRLGDRGLIVGCGRRTARGNSGRPGRRCWPTARPPLFSVWDLAIGGGGALRQQPLATAGRRAAFGRARTLLDFGIGRAPLLLKSAQKGGRVNTLCAPFPRAREGGASASGFDPAAPARSYGDCSAEPIETRWLRVGCGVCALWHFRLGDRALIRGRAVAERRAANSWSPWSPMLADGEARRCFLFGTWRSAVAELFGNSRSQQLAAGQPSDVLALCWILASAERDRSLNLLRKGGRVTPLRAVSSRARGRRLSQRFRSGGAGAELWGLRREPIETAG